MRSAVRRVLAILASALTLAACGGGGGGGGGGSSTPPPPAPTISAQPAAQTVNAGASASFSVTASGATAYQWQRNGAAIAGATGASYAFTTTTANNGDSYTVVASNAGGSVTSTSAALRVTGVAVLAGQLGGEGYVDGDAAVARLWGPVGVALDASGNLYVADYNAIRKVTPGGTVSTLAGSPRDCGGAAGTGSAARFCYPTALTTDAAGDVYVTDFSTNLWRVDPSGVSTSYAALTGSCPSSLAIAGSVLYVGDACSGAIVKVQGGLEVQGGAVSPFVTAALYVSGLALDSSLNLYVAADTVVQSVTTGGAVSTIAGNGSPGSADGTGNAAQFGCVRPVPGPEPEAAASGAYGIATRATGATIVTDYCHNTLRTVSAGGTVQTVAGTAGVAGSADGPGGTATFWGPAGAVADGAGNVYVADYLNALVRKIDPNGNVTTVVGQKPHAGSTDGAASAATFRYPFGVAADAQGNLYVTDSNNHTVRKITAAGVVSTLAGTPGVSGILSGPGTTAQFNLPLGLTIDSAGNLYVADSQNAVIRKVTPAGVVSNAGGLIGTPGSANGAAGTLLNPNAVAIDSSGALYVTDQNGVRKIAPDGTVSTLAPLSDGSAITLAPSGTLYIGARSGTVYSLPAAGGTLTTIASKAGQGAIQGIVLAGDGNLYVSDRNYSTVNQVTLAGVVTPVIGSATLPIATVPGGLPARVNGPSGLALLSAPGSSHVSLAIVDSFEHAILTATLP